MLEVLISFQLLLPLVPFRPHRLRVDGKKNEEEEEEGEREEG